MQTTINNNERIFLITGDMNRHIFCNLKDIPAAVADIDDKSYMKIQHYWNGSFKRASKRMLNDMFKGTGMKFRIV